MTFPDTHYSGFEFVGFRLDLGERLLFYDDEPVSLTPKAWETLRVLLEREGGVVGRDELIQEVWPETFVEYGVLTQNIYTLRKVLAERGGGGSFIETVHRRGYRFVPPVKRLAERTPEPISSAQSLAVLPFQITGIDEREVFGLAMADALISRLGRLDRLHIRPISAVQAFGQGDRDPMAAGKRLRVDAVLDGRLESDAGGLRITARLLRVNGSLEELWSGQFEGERGALLDLQDQLSARVAEGLRLGLSEPERDRLALPGKTSSEAYQAYVRGRYFWNRRTAADLLRAISHFEDAVRHDGRFALAHSGLADTYVLLPFYGKIPPEAAFPKASAAALEALTLDDSLAEAHTSLAYTRYVYEWDWEASEAAFCRAIELNPGYPTARHWYACLLTTLRRHDEAVREARLARQLDPLSPAIQADLAMNLYFAGRVEESIEEFRSIREQDPAFVYGRFGLSFAYARAGRLQEALEEASRTMELVEDDSVMLACCLGYALAMTGRIDEARETLQELQLREAGGEYVQPSRMAVVAANVGEIELALTLLERAFASRSRFLVFVHVWPVYDVLRDEPRFQKLLHNMRLL